MDLAIVQIGTQLKVLFCSIRHGDMLNSGLVTPFPKGTSASRFFTFKSRAADSCTISRIKFESEQLALCPSFAGRERNRRVDSAGGQAGRVLALEMGKSTVDLNPITPNDEGCSPTGHSRAQIYALGWWDPAGTSTPPQLPFSDRAASSSPHFKCIRTAALTSASICCV
jgi:hypothetical protein